MMNVSNFITKTDYQEFKKIMLKEFITKPLDIKATDSDGIVIEVRASQIAIEKLLKAFKRFEGMATVDKVEQKPFR